MSRIETIDKIISIITNDDSIEFGEAMKMQKVLKDCKEVIKKNKPKDTTSTKYRSKQMTEWRNGWFGKEK